MENILDLLKFPNLLSSLKKNSSETLDESSGSIHFEGSEKWRVFDRWDVQFCWFNTYSGWWLTYPSEKDEFVSWDYYSQYMEKKKCSKPPTSISL